MRLRGQDGCCKPVPWLKDFLKERGIQSSGKRKAELIELCVKSSEIKAPKIAEEEAVVNPVILVNDQLNTPDEGNLPNPLIRECGLSKWTQNFSNVHDFRFPDLFNYLVGKDPGYNPESLKSYKSLLGYKLISMDTWKTCVIIHHNLLPAFIVT